MGPHFTVRKWTWDAIKKARDYMLQWGRTSQCGNGQDGRAALVLHACFNGAALHSAEMAEVAAPSLSDAPASMGPHFTVRKWSVKDGGEG